jgi:DMSO/TMAO reductase YedYZ molybdopterin-dependent catalytic subunit
MRFANNVSVSVLRGFVVGAIAGLAFLLVELLARTVFGIPTLPELVQDRLLLLLPGALFAFILERLLYLAKPLFFAGLLLLQLVLLGLGGLIDSRRRRALLLAGALWLFTGAILAPLSGRGPYAGDPRIALTTLAAFAAYGLALRLARRPLAHGRQPSWQRRELLAGGALVLLSGVLTQRLIAGMTTARTTAGAGASPAEVPEPLAGVAIPPGLPPPITQTDAFYIVSKNLDDPVVDGTTWHLQVIGLVDQPLDLSRDALTALPAVQITRTLECISNEVGGDLISTGVWTGLRLADILQRAGVRSGATAVVFHSVDGYVETMALDKAQDPNTLLAYALNGQPLPTKHGFPLRVLGSGTYGMKNSKWLTQIDVVAATEPGFWEQQGWNPDAPVQTMARIDTPKDGKTVTGGTSISGVAFAADRGMQRVEVSTDGGSSWSNAELLPSLGPSTWVFWHIGWQPEGSSAATLVVRAVDGTGQTQTDRRVDSFPNGSSGYHSIRVLVA